MVLLTCKMSKEFKNIYGVFITKDIRNMCLTHTYYKLRLLGGFVWVNAVSKIFQLHNSGQLSCVPAS